MRIFQTKTDLGKLKGGSVLTIGNFDGVHLGHKRIIETARRTASDRGIGLSVMTFEPHPVAILHPEKAPSVLMPLEIKKHFLDRLGVDNLIVLRDSAELLRLSSAEFVDEFLAKDVKPAVVVEGEDFNFGAGRSGNVHTLQSLGHHRGFEVMIVEAVERKLSIGQSVRVSSTIIRNLLESGKVADAELALGRRYRLVGPVISGRGKGKKLGFATANMERPGQIIPAEGVYAGFVGIGEDFEQACTMEAGRASVFSIGKTSTYGAGQDLLIEAHLLESDIGDLIGKFMAMDFVEHIREQQKFDTEQELAEQIAKDCAKAREILK